MSSLPKVLNVYWGRQPLSYLQYLTVVSFKKHNPEWKVNLWMPATGNIDTPNWPTREQRDPYLGKDYLEQLKKICQVRLVDFDALGLSHLHEVHKSDLIRWKILHEVGGVWSDMDILYIRPIIKTETPAVVFDGFHYIIGFFIAKPGENLFENLYKAALEAATKNQLDEYQSIGSSLFKRLYPELPREATNLPMQVVYPYIPHLPVIAEMLFGTDDYTTDETIGIHWYNGSREAKEYQNNFDIYRKNGSVISKYVKELELCFR